MGKRSPAPPPTPDYSKIAMLQGQANLEAAKQSAYMSNPNVYTPTAQQTVQWTKQPQFNQEAYDKAMQDYWSQAPDGYTGPEPSREQFTTYVEQPTIRQELVGPAKDIFATQQQAEQAMANLGLREIGDLSQFLGQDFQAQLPQIQTTLGGYGQVAQAPNAAAYGQATGIGPQGEIVGPPQAGQYGPLTQFGAGQLPGQYAPTGTAQGLQGALPGVSTGPAAGQFGMAGGGPQAQTLQQINPAAFGAIQGAPGAGQYGLAQGGPSAGLYGLAGGGPAAPQVGGLNLAGVGTAQAGVTGGQFGAAAGGPQGVQFGGLDTSGLMGIQGGVGQFGQAQGGTVAGPQLGGLNTFGVGRVQRAPGQGQFGYAQQFVEGPELQRQIDVQGLAAAPISAGTTAQQAIMSRLGPQLQGERQQLYTQLINQGLVPGGEAFNAAMSAQAQKENDLILQAAAQGIALDQAARQQGFAEQQSRAMFANQAALQGFGAGMEQAGLYNVGLGQNVQQALATQAAANAAQQQAFQQRLAGAEFGQQTELARFGAGMQSEAARNQAIAQNTQLALQSGQFANQAQAQQFAQRLAAGEFGREAQLASFQTGQQAQQAINAAIAQNFQQAMAADEAARAAQAQRFGQAVTGTQVGAELAGQQFGMAQQAQQTQNQAIAQNFAQAQQAQQAQNQAAAQNFQQALAAQQAANQAQQQGYAQQMGAGEFNREALLAQFGMGQQAQQAANQAMAQNFAQAQAAAQMQNQAGAQQFGQQVTAQELQNQALAQNQAQALAAYQANLARQQQGFQQAGAQAEFTNRAQAQAYQQAMAQQAAANAAQQQRFGQAMDIQGLYNAAMLQNYQMAMSQQAAQNAAQQQQYNQMVGAATFGNQAVQQALQQQLALRNQPLNEISALLSGSQVQMPQFQGYSGVQVAATPYLQAAQAQDAAAMQRYGIQANQAASNASGLYGLAGSLGSAAIMSDRRLKSNIVRVGTHPLGIGIYEYDIFGERQRGVMADEVQRVKPEAVVTHPSGYNMVKYGLLL
jgi:hypothetical protein